MNLIFNKENDICNIASQISQQIVEKNIKLNEYTQQQLLLAEENSSDIHTTTNSLRIYLKYDFPDGSSISFLIEGNV